MTRPLDKALEAVRRLPQDAQDGIATTMRERGSQDQPKVVDSAHSSPVLEGPAQARRGQFASEAEVEAAFRRFDG
jgi:hypothetical protein